MKPILLILFLSLSCHASDIASWYYPRTNGMVCACREFAIGTRLKVTEIHNKLSIVVVVIERGPNLRFTGKRRVDLSAMAFSRLAGLELGLAEVRIEVVK